MTADDRLRRDLIERVMCDLEVDVEAIAAEHGILFRLLMIAAGYEDGNDANCLRSRSRARASGRFSNRHSLAVDPAAFLVEFEGHSPRAVERKFEMQFVDAAHHRQIV